MKHTSRLATLLTIGGAIIASAASQAQAPNSGQIPPEALARIQAAQSQGQGPTGAPGATDVGSVSNATTTTTTTTTAGSPEVITAETDTAPLANTGGEPWIMAMGGMVIAGSAFMLRRRYNN